MLGEATEEQRKPGRPKKIRKPGRPKKITPKPRVRVQKSPKGKRGRPPKPKLGVETELAEEMCLTLQDSMERRGTTASSAAAATADADLDSRDEAYKEKAELEHQLAADNQKLKDSRDEAIKERDLLLKEIGILRGELKQVREDYEHGLKENIRCTDALEETCSSQRHKISVLERELDDANQKLKVADLSYKGQKRIVADLQDRLLESDKCRKKLHNAMLELKGRIRVFLRVRPLPDDGPGAEPTVSYPTSVALAGRGIDLIQNGQKHSFTFDMVFAHGATQRDIFMEISELIQSALDGYKVCIFSYGQTGSGKTYTMTGTQEAPGLIPQSLAQIFQKSEALAAAQGWKYKMKVSILEIYNDKIRDLLGSKIAGKEEYKISHDKEGNTTVAGLAVFDVSTIGEVNRLLQRAAIRRSVGSTDMNVESSRSHYVLRMSISSVNESTGQQVQGGILNMVDLAGSERLSKSGATGDTLKETQAINKSLSSFENVMRELKNKDDHVSYRNCKLTYLLQPCLSGDSKTLMFVHVSPHPSSFAESLCSLNFAKRVSSIELGPAHLKRGREAIGEQSGPKRNKAGSRSEHFQSPRAATTGRAALPLRGLPRGAGDFAVGANKKKKVEFQLDQNAMARAMSIEEAGLKEMEMMNTWHTGGDDDEDEDDEAAQDKARAFDDWKDENPRGAGNSKLTPCG